MSRRAGLVGASALNALGQILPLAAALLTIPPTIRALGDERFGILAMAWALIGAFSLFDFGLGRALTQLVAASVAEGHETAPPVTWWALRMLLGIGMVVGLLAGIVAPFLLPLVLRQSPHLWMETSAAAWWLALGIPAVLLTSGFSGILAAFHRFGTLNALRIPIGTLAFALPLFLVLYRPTLPVAVGGLVFVRVAGLVAHLIACRGLLPHWSARWTAADRGPLLTFGAWMTVSNLINPLMLYLDRFVIATVASAVAVAHYSVPYDVMTRLLFAAGAVSSAAYPAFAASIGEPGAMRHLLTRSSLLVGAVTFPVLVAVVALAPEAMRWWLGSEFAAEGVDVARMLAIGVFANGVAQVCAALIQGAAKPKLTAMLHVAELPFYLLLLFIGVREFGALGAALAWTARVAVDAALLMMFAWKITGGSLAAGALRGLALVAIASVVAVPAAWGALLPRVVSAAALILAAGIAGWWAWSRRGASGPVPELRVGGMGGVP